MLQMQTPADRDPTLLSEKKEHESVMWMAYFDFELIYCTVNDVGTESQNLGANVPSK